jgi:hypothetical protein
MKKESRMFKRGSTCVLWSVIGVVLLTALLVSEPMALAQDRCVGDCDYSGSVAINELIAIVNILLGNGELYPCPGLACDTVNIACAVRSVSSSLNGCPTGTTAATAGIVFNGEGNRLAAYQPGPGGFPKQVVIPSAADVPGGVGRDLNAQICFTRGPGGEVRFIAGEDTNQGSEHASAGWGFFQLSGGRVGDFGFEEIGKLIPTYQPTVDDAENYGCGFLSDGRLLTTDVGNQAMGPPTGQLIIWFPPFDNGANYTETGVFPDTPGRYCKLDIGIGTAQSIAIDAQDTVYVAASRPGSAGIYRYTGPFPTSDTPDGGCDGTDSTGAPMATSVNKVRFIRPDASLPTPAGVVLKPDGGFYVSSVLNGVINEYDSQGTLVRTILRPPTAGLPHPTGSPLGLGLASDGTIYFADVGLVLSPGGIGPGFQTGGVRRIRFVNGQPQPPERMDSGLNFPDGIGVLEFPPPTATPEPEEERTRKPTATLRPPRTPLP